MTLAGDETVNVTTAVNLAALPNFTIGTNTLHLAAGDYANAASLNVLADFGSHFDFNGSTVQMTQDDLVATPAEYTTLEADLGTNVIASGHVLSAMPTGFSVSSVGGNVTVTASGVSGATLHVYAAGGGSLSSSVLGSTAISVTHSDAFGSVGGAVVITETVGGVESAPLIALDQTVVTTDAGVATFATTGQVQVGASEYVNLYNYGSQPTQTAPELVYNPTTYVLSLDVNGTFHTLVTLGTATHPTSLNAAEINITHFV